MKWMSAFGKSATLTAALVSLVATSPVYGEIVSGNGEWQSQSGAAMRGTWTVTLERSGSDLKGTIALTGSLLFSGGAVTGTLDGDQLMLGTVADGENQVTFSGTMNDEKITGEWHSPAVNDSGTWSGTLRIAAIEDLN